MRLGNIKAASPDAKAFLESAVLGRVLILEDATEDRHGRVAATVFIQGETKSIEELLLREGFAFVYPVLDDTRLDDLCAIEREARASKRGFWATPKDVPAEEAKKLSGKYGFVVGVVSKAERIENKVFLSFGAQDRPDFTVIIAARYLRSLKKQRLEPLSLQGKTIRVRGWVGGTVAPTITITDSHQIEWAE